MNRSILYTIAIIAFLSCSFQKKGKEILKSYYPSGKIKSITEVENGRKNGKEELYYDNGNLFIRQYFKNDLPIDSFYQYKKDEANVIHIRGYCEVRARATSYLLDSMLFSENDFKENLVTDGMMKIYFSDGKVGFSSFYKDGKKDGVAISYYENGNIKQVHHFKMGVRVPPTLEFDTAGKMTKYEPVIE